MQRHRDCEEMTEDFISWLEFEISLVQPGVNYVHHDYENVQYGFHNDTTPRYARDVAELGRQRTVEFFKADLNEQA